jgi:hypothetical protein
LNKVIEQIETSPAWQARLKSLDPNIKHGRRVAATDQEFMESPASLPKTVQRALTSPTERLVFGKQEIAANGTDLSSIIIDPANITDTLLRNLGLGRYLPPKRARADESIGYHALAIPDIKEMLANLQPLENFHLQPLQHGRFRLMRIAGGPYEGYVFGTQTEEHNTHFFRCDLHGAYRRINHIREGYEDETRELSQILDTIKYISSNIVTRWREIKHSDELEVYRKELLALVDSLKFVRNRHKKGIRDTIERCLTFKTKRRLKQKIGTDRGGKTMVKRPERIMEVDNPGAVSAKFTKVGAFVARRRAEIIHTIAGLMRDQIKLHRVICDHEVPFERFYRDVENMHRDFVLLHEDRSLTPEKKKRTIGNLLALKAQCRPAEKPDTGSKIVMQPYLSFGGKMAEHIDETVAELRKDAIDREAAASAFLKIYLVAKIHYLFHELQGFYDKFLSPSYMPDFNEMHGAAKRINRAFGGKRVDEKINGREIDAPEYNRVYGELYHLLNSILLKIRRAVKASSEGNKDLPEKMKYEIRERMREFKFEELLNVH